MNNLQTIKAEKESKISELIEKCSMFFAFSNEQFNQNKTPLQEGEKYVSIGMGSYLPKGQVDNYINGVKEINKWFKDTIKSNKVRREHILYELCNHEAFYTNDIGDTLETLGEYYTEAEVMEVFRSERKKQQLAF